MGTIGTRNGHGNITRIFVVAMGITALSLVAAGCQSESGDDGSAGLSSPLTSSTLGDLNSPGGTPPTLEDIDGRLDLTPGQTQLMQDALDKWTESRPATGERPRSHQMPGNSRERHGGSEPGSEMRGEAHTFLMDCAAFLDADQMVSLIEYFKERCEGHREACLEGGRGQSRHGRFEGQVTRILEQLDLTKEQEAEATSLIERHREAMSEFRSQWTDGNRPDADMREQMRTLRQEFHERLEAIIGAENMVPFRNHSQRLGHGQMGRSGDGMHARTGHSIEFLTAVLHLTEAQQAQLEQIFATARDTRESIRESVPDGEFPSDDAIGELGQLREETDAAIRGTLTPGQLRVFEALQGMTGRRGWRMHRP